MLYSFQRPCLMNILKHDLISVRNFWLRAIICKRLFLIFGANFQGLKSTLSSEICFLIRILNQENNFYFRNCVFFKLCQIFWRLSIKCISSHKRYQKILWGYSFDYKNLFQISPVSLWNSSTVIKVLCAIRKSRAISSFSSQIYKYLERRKS